MAKKCNCPPPGAPEWVLTYGDMMSLLLCFFIILVALSEIKKEDQYKAIVKEVKKAFGMKGGGGTMPTTEDPEMSLIKRLDEMDMKKLKQPEHSNADDPGIDGREASVTRVREGDRFIVGGRITFEPGSSELSDLNKRGLLKVAEELRGYNTKIELTGHAASMEIMVGSTHTDLWELSYARAKAVMDFLTSKEIGIRPERIRLIANGDYEPVRRKVWTTAQQEPNRRVEIYRVESLVEDFTKSESR